MRWARPFWFALGVMALGLGLVGVVLPLLPTTVFLLVAAFAFARSSDRLHDWLVHHPRLGPPIRDWRAHGAIGRRAKVLAILVMVAAFAGSAIAGVSTMILAVQAIVLAGAAVFVLTRPHPPDHPENRGPP